MGRAVNFQENPCCCCDLQIGVLVIGILGIINNLIELLICAVFGLVVGTLIYWLRVLSPAEFWLIFVKVLVGLAAAIVLTLGAVKKDLRWVQIGFIGYIVYVVLAVISFLLGFVFTFVDYGYDLNLDAYGVVVLEWVTLIQLIPHFLIAVVVLGYVLYVIYAYVKQLSK